jgi:hypothetical protein
LKIRKKTGLYGQLDLQLPTPAAILGGMDPNAPNADLAQGRVRCLRETTAHSDFLMLFAQTVVMKDVYRAKHTTGLLETFMGPNLEAFAVLTYTNNYDRWKEQCEIAALPEEERANRRPVAVRRFTEGARGGGRYRGWDETGIWMYNDLAARRIKLQAGTWDLQSFEILRTSSGRHKYQRQCCKPEGRRERRESTMVLSGMQPRKCLVMVRKAMKRMPVPLLVGCSRLLLKLLLVLLKVGMEELLLQRSVVWCRACFFLVVLAPAGTENN